MATSSSSAQGKAPESKRDLSSPEGVLRSLVAVASTAGGTVLVGLEARTRQVRDVRRLISKNVWPP
jgi:ATP-dependent DNA helicase RecG